VAEELVGQFFEKWEAVRIWGIPLRSVFRAGCGRMRKIAAGRRPIEVVGINAVPSGSPLAGGIFQSPTAS
jgi:hypothetical protein